MNEHVTQIPYIISTYRFRKCLMYVNYTSTKLLFKKENVSHIQGDLPLLDEALGKFCGREYYNNT